MELKRFIDDDDAVSPVIGVILMVAITVILAAVIATFVLGLGDQISDTGPTVSFDMEYDEGDGELTVTHSNGNTVEAGNLYLRGSTAGSGNEYSGSWVSVNDIGTNGYGASSQIRSGSSITIGVTSSDTVRVIWESASGGQSKTLDTWRGSNA